MKKGIVDVLVKNESYELAVDDITIDLIIQNKINYNRIDRFLNSTKATEYSRVIDAQGLKYTVKYGNLLFASPEKERLHDDYL